MSDERVTLTVSRAEALVLFELLTREEEPPIRCEDEAEEMVLWRIQGQLEKLLTEPFSPVYAELLAAARKTVRER